MSIGDENVFYSLINPLMADLDKPLLSLTFSNISLLHVERNATNSLAEQYSTVLIGAKSDIGRCDISMGVIGSDWTCPEITKVNFPFILIDHYFYLPFQ